MEEGKEVVSMEEANGENGEGINKYACGCAVVRFYDLHHIWLWYVRFSAFLFLSHAVAQKVSPAVRRPACYSFCMSNPFQIVSSLSF